jgi:hypothetical protein
MESRLIFVYNAHSDVDKTILTDEEHIIVKFVSTSQDGNELFANKNLF